MSATAYKQPVITTRSPLMSSLDHSPSPDASRCRHAMSTGDELVALGWEVNAHRHRIVRLAARFDAELEWHRQGLKSASRWIAEQLQVQSSTAREWIRVGHALRHLPLIDAAFASQELSYAKVRILTRWADADNEVQLLSLARERTADRLSTAIARSFADDGETDEAREVRLHEERAFTSWTDGDGMTIMRVALAPSSAKPMLAAIEEVVRRIAQMPANTLRDPSAGATGGRSVSALRTEGDRDPSADATGGRSVSAVRTEGDRDPSAGATSGRSVTEMVTHGGRAQSSGSADRRTMMPSPIVGAGCVPDRTALVATLAELRQWWQPSGDDDWVIPTLAQQRADAFVALFLGLGVDLTTEVVVHVRGDGLTFDDGTPTTNSAVLRQLDRSFIRVLIHDAQRRPIDASGRRRHPTTRQQRVVMEAHGHECVDCQSPDLLELDHNPPYSETLRTVTDELEPRCAPCHRARHRHDSRRSSRSSA